MSEYIYIYLIIFFNLFIILKFDSFKFFKINIDKPDGYRKLHKTPTPLAGGTIIALNISLYSIFISVNSEVLYNELFFENHINLIIFFSTSLLVFFTGFLDDKFNFNPILKFFIISIIILFLIYFDSSLKINIIKFSFFENEFNISQYSIIFTLFCFLVFLNAFNMIDGINLQTSSYSIILFVSIHFLYAETLLIKTLLICIIAYSYLNYRNKSFLGDSGSLLLSFVIGYSFIKFYNQGLITYSDEVVIYMLVPGLDLIRLFFKRISSKKNPLKGDRLHLHHLLLLKFSYLKTLIIFLLLVMLPVILNAYSFSKIYIISLTIIIYTLIIFIIRPYKLK